MYFAMAIAGLLAPIERSKTRALPTIEKIVKCLSELSVRLFASGHFLYTIAGNYFMKGM